MRLRSLILGIAPCVDAETGKLAGDQSESRLFERKGEGPLGILGILGDPRAGWSMPKLFFISPEPQILTATSPQVWKHSATMFTWGHLLSLEQSECFEPSGLLLSAKTDTRASQSHRKVPTLRDQATEEIERMDCFKCRTIHCAPIHAITL